MKQLILLTSVLIANLVFSGRLYSLSNGEFSQDSQIALARNNLETNKTQIRETQKPLLKNQALQNYQNANKQFILAQAKGIYCRGYYTIKVDKKKAGYREGLQKIRQKIALNMLKKKMNIPLISLVTSLSVQEIEKLKNSDKKEVGDSFWLRLRKSMQKSIQQNIQIGMHKGLQEIVLNMLKKKMNMDLILSVTGLSLREITQMEKSDKSTITMSEACQIPYSLRIGTPCHCTFPFFFEGKVNFR